MAGTLQRSGGPAARAAVAGEALRSGPRARPATRLRTWVALFRAINVGGRNRLPMAALAALLAGLGLREVRTYTRAPRGIGRARLAAGAERGTGHNLRTVSELLRLAGEGAAPG